MLSDKIQKDKESIDEILTEIGIIDTVDQLKKITRLKKTTTGGKPGNILLECVNKEQKLSILKAARGLRESARYKDVYINSDLTSAQLEQGKKLRLERNDRNSKLTLTDDRNLKYGLHKFGDDQAESKYYWGIRNGEIKKIKVAL